MRSRWHAVGTAIVAGVLPLLGWLSTVIVALVVLRLGAAAGTLILLWALLPVGASFYLLGDPSPMIAMFGTFFMAMLLRQTFSWELVLVTAVLLSAVGALVFQTVAAGILENFANLYVEYLGQIDAALAIDTAQAKTLLIGFFALGQAVAMVVMLIIARWCQSALYNPGGFRKEFHALRLSPMVSAGIVAAMLVCFVFDEQLGKWLPLLTVPLLFAAIGLVHWTISAKALSGGWIGGFYASLILLFQLVYPFLASVALMDSWFNIRNRIEIKQKD